MRSCLDDDLVRGIDHGIIADASDHALVGGADSLLVRFDLGTPPRVPKRSFGCAVSYVRIFAASFAMRSMRVTTLSSALSRPASSFTRCRSSICVATRSSFSALARKSARVPQRCFDAFDGSLGCGEVRTGAGAPAALAADQS